MIKMYWWQGGGGTGNFGDKLAPALVEAITGQRVVHSPIHRSDMVAIGSVLEPWFWPQDSWLDFSGCIWGAGRMFGKGTMAFPKAHVVSVRGELTAGSLSCSASSELAVGDPGLLCGHFHRSIPRAKYKLGLWPHWSEVTHLTIQRMLRASPEIRLIDPCGDLRESLDLAGQCETIASSSLHGLVIADALAIPNCWLRLNTGREENAGMPIFKYMDYFSAFQAGPPMPIVLDDNTTLEQILSHATTDRHIDVARLQNDLLSVLPFPRANALL